MSFLPSVLMLGTLALIAAMLAKLRPSPAKRGRERNSASLFLAVATIFQALHFVEEMLLGFHIRFPELFGLTPIPFLLFVLFNVACILLWAYSVFAIKQADSFAFGAAWFLALAGISNGIAHPVMTLVSGGYFPGLISAFPVAAACCGLSISLLKATKPIYPDPVL